MIAAREHALIERMRARQDLFVHYLDPSFDERETTFTELFRALDTDPANVASVPGSITALACTSPFAVLQNIELVEQNLADPDYVWIA